MNSDKMAWLRIAFFGLVLLAISAFALACYTEDSVQSADHVDPTYVEALVRDGIEYAHPDVLANATCESKWSNIDVHRVAMAACWGAGRDVYLLTWIRHFRRSLDDYDIHVFTVENVSPGHVLLADCYLLRDEEVPQHTDDCVGIVSDIEVRERLAVRWTQWASY